MRLWTRDDLPEGEWREYRKAQPTRMIRMTEPFACKTVDGNHAVCSDGWLAVDSQGHPYPVDASEHEASYKPARKR